jgi:hypothetical protein
MMKPPPLRFASATSVASVVFIATLFTAGSPLNANIDQLQSSFDQPPDNTRIMVRWWWFGSSVTKPEIQSELNIAKSGAIGGFDVEPV